MWWLMQKRLRVIALPFCFFASAANASDAYKWIDSSGHIHYGDKPVFEGLSRNNGDPIQPWQFDKQPPNNVEIDKRKTDIENGRVRLNKNVVTANSLVKTINGCEIRKSTECTGVNLKNTDLSKAVLDGANLAGADLSGASLRDATLTKSNLSGAYLKGADLVGADFSDANLSGAVFDRANIVGTYFRRANMTGAKLRHLPYIQAYFRNANLERTDFTNSKLMRTVFDSCNLHNTKFDGADLSDVDMVSSDPSTASFLNAKIDKCVGCVPDIKRKEEIIRSGNGLRQSYVLKNDGAAALPHDVQAVLQKFEHDNKFGIQITDLSLYVLEVKHKWDVTAGRMRFSHLGLSGDGKSIYVTYYSPRKELQKRCDSLAVGITASIYCPNNPLCKPVGVPGSLLCAVHVDYDLHYSGYVSVIHCENDYEVVIVPSGIEGQIVPGLRSSSGNNEGCYPQPFGSLFIPNNQ